MVDRRYEIYICVGASCISSGSDRVKSRFEAELRRRGLEGSVDVGVIGTGCMGPCAKGPLVRVEPGDVIYHHVRVDDVVEIIEGHLVNGRVVERLLAEELKDSFYRKQRKVVLSNCGVIDPEDIGDYERHGGYEGLKKALDMGYEW